MIRVILRLFWYDLSYIQYSSKDPCCSLACVKQPIAVPTRHTHFCSSSSSLATFSTCNHYRRLVDTIPRAPRASSHFQILLSSLFKSCTVVWFTQNNEKFSKLCKGHTVNAQFAAFFFCKKVRFAYVTLLECGNCFTRSTRGPFELFGGSWCHAWHHRQTTLC